MYNDLIRTKKEIMLKCFERQLKNNKPITEKKLYSLKGKSIYSNYKINDIILGFFELTKQDNGRDLLTFKVFTLREINKIIKEYKFVDYRNVLPTLKKGK